MINKNCFTRLKGLFISLGVFFLCNSLEVQANVGEVNKNDTYVIVPITTVTKENLVNTSCQNSSAGEDKIVFQLHFQQTIGYENVYKKLNIPL